MAKFSMNLVFVTACLLAVLVGRMQLADADGGDTTLIHACVNNTNGQVRIVGPNDSCKNNESPLHWATAPAAGSSPPVQLLALLAETDLIQSDSAVFEDMPGMSGAFTTSASGCVTAFFSLIATVTTNFCPVRILLDDILMEGQSRDDGAGGSVLGEIPFKSGVSSYGVWKCGVSSGAHTIKVQWIGGSPGSTPCAFAGRTLIVQGP